MELELKHLQSYKLGKDGITVKADNSLWKVSAILFDEEIVELMNDLNAGTYEYHISDIELSLLPLSYLTKEIEHNGDKFVPVEYFEIGDGSNDSIEYGYGNVKLIGLLKDMAKHNFIDLKYLQYGIVEKLLEWKFDIYGLIEKGLAIDKTTLNK